MKSRNVFTVLLAVWLFLLNMLPALAATEMEKQQKELDKAQHNVQVAEENKDKAKLKVAAAKESLGEIVAKLSRLQQDIDKLQKKADALQKDIDENTAVLSKKKEEMEGRMRIYRRRLRDIYENGQINYLEVLLGAKDFGDFASRMYLLQKIIRSRTCWIPRWRKSKRIRPPWCKSAMMRKKCGNSGPRNCTKQRKKNGSPKRSTTACWRSRIISNPCCRAWKPLP